MFAFWDRVCVLKIPLRLLLSLILGSVLFYFLFFSGELLTKRIFKVT